MEMEMIKESLVLAIGALLAVAIVCFSGLRCSQLSKDALNQCIEKTQKPLECQAAFRGSNQ